MTRGTFYTITNDLIIETIEFNGGMYPTEHGKDAIEMLENINNLQEFTVELKKFNKEKYNYDSNELFFPHERKEFMKKENVIDMSKNYYELFFSDWTFWKNFSNETVKFKTSDKKEIELKPQEQIAINYGKYARHYKSLKDCQEIIEKENA